MLYEIFITVLLGVVLGGLFTPFLLIYRRYRRYRYSREYYLQHWSPHDRDRRYRDQAVGKSFAFAGLIVGYVSRHLLGLQPPTKPWQAVAMMVVVETVAGLIGRAGMEQHEEIKGDYQKVWIGLSFGIGICGGLLLQD